MIHRSKRQQCKDLLDVQRSLNRTLSTIDEVLHEREGECIPSVKTELRVKRSRVSQIKLDISHLIISLRKD